MTLILLYPDIKIRWSWRHRKVLGIQSTWKTWGKHLLYCKHNWGKCTRNTQKSFNISTVWATLQNYWSLILDNGLILLNSLQGQYLTSYLILGIDIKLFCLLMQLRKHRWRHLFPRGHVYVRVSQGATIVAEALPWGAELGNNWRESEEPF